MIISLCLQAIISHISYLFIESYLYIICGNFIKKINKLCFVFCSFTDEQLWTRICSGKLVIFVYWQVSILSAIVWLVWFVAFNATFNNISVIFGGVLLLKETGIPGENHQPAVVTVKLCHIMFYRVLIATTIRSLPQVTFLDHLIQRTMWADLLASLCIHRL